MHSSLFFIILWRGKVEFVSLDGSSLQNSIQVEVIIVVSIFKKQYFFTVSSDPRNLTTALLWLCLTPALLLLIIHLIKCECPHLSLRVWEAAIFELHRVRPAFVGQWPFCQDRKGMEIDD